MKTFPFKGQPANKIVSMFPMRIPNKRVSLQKSPEASLFCWMSRSFHVVRLLYFFSYENSLDPTLPCWINFLPSWPIRFGFVYYLQYKLHSNIRKKLLFLHWETNMIPKQIPSSSKLWQNKNHLHFSRQTLCGHHSESAASWIWIMKWLQINKLLVNFWGRDESYLTPSVIVD